MKKLSLNPKIIREVVAKEPEMRRIQMAAMVDKAFKALDSAAHLTESDPPWLWKLKIKGKTAFYDKEVEIAFMESAKSDTNDTFEKAAAALSMPLNDAEIKSKINKVEWVLLEHWLASENAPLFRSFCYYNDKALAKLIDYLLGFNKGHFNDKSIRKIWERLDLKKSQRLLFCDVEINMKPKANQFGAVPIPYNKLIQV